MDLVSERPGMKTRFCHLQVLSLMYLRQVALVILRLIFHTCKMKTPEIHFMGLFQELK